MRWWLLVLLAGCNGDGGGGGGLLDGDGDGQPGGSSTSDDDVEFPARDADEILEGNLADGSTIDLDWADDSSVACWVGSENQNFNGAHVFFEIDKEDMDDIVVQVDPESGVDVSIYTLEFAGGDVQTPPDVTSASRCEAAFDQASDSNPGSAESIQLLGFQDRTILLGVAGAGGATSGAFTVKVWRSSTNGFGDTGEEGSS
jgi:hypothetical protein